MQQFTVAELHAIANNMEEQLNNPKMADDPKWLQRRIDRVRKLAAQKEKAIEHKRNQ